MAVKQVGAFLKFSSITFYIWNHDYDEWEAYSVSVSRNHFLFFQPFQIIVSVNSVTDSWFLVMILAINTFGSVAEDLQSFCLEKNTYLVLCNLHEGDISANVLWMIFIRAISFSKQQLNKLYYALEGKVDN